jgi:hypothetical protein
MQVSESNLYSGMCQKLASSHIIDQESYLRGKRQ